MATVVIKDMKFIPSTVKVAPGEPVNWVSEEEDEDMVHTATADDGSFDTGNLKTGQTSKPFPFTKTTSYYCKKHPKSMKGVVEVQA